MGRSRVRYVTAWNFKERLNRIGMRTENNRLTVRQLSLALDTQEQFIRRHFEDFRGERLDGYHITFPGFPWENGFDPKIFITTIEASKILQIPRTTFRHRAEASCPDRILIGGKLWVPRTWMEEQPEFPGYTKEKIDPSQNMRVKLAGECIVDAAECLFKDDMEGFHRKFKQAGLHLQQVENEATSE